MDEHESEIERLEKAIAALNTQRATLGEAVAATAIAPLQEKLDALRASAYGEQRKLVTVLFADLAGHTQLFSRLDSEDVRELLNTYFTSWKETIQKNGGQVEKFIGDAVMAVFGLPVVREDDAERAVWAALEMRRRLEELNREFEGQWGTRLGMRVGITSGEVVVGALGERQAEEFSVVGETVNLAARLQAAAPQDGILISQSCYNLVRGIFSVRSLQPVQVKGVAGPVQVYLVQGAKPRSFHLVTRGVEGIETKMIGREAELKRVQDAFLDVKEYRECQVITIFGEAGLGKSRLIYELSNWLELFPENIYYFKGRAYASTLNTPYSLVRNLFAFRFSISDSDPPDLVWEKLKTGIGEVLGEQEALTRKVYFIGRLLGFDVQPAGQFQERSADVRQFHEQALVYLGEYFRTLAQSHPIVVLLEDLHWADDSSLDLIYRLGGSLAKQPLLIVSTARPVLLHRRPNWGEGIEYYHALRLQPLSRRDSKRLVDEILQKAEVVPAELRERLAERAEGNPFYIEEGIKMLIEEGAIEKTADRWRIRPERLAAISIPSTLAGILQARLDSLPADQRLLVQRAAVVGRVFWDQAVAYLSGPSVAAPSPDPAGESEILAELRRREIVFQRERSSFEDTREYLFKHVMLRDTAYESLLKKQRREYHGRCARWLERATQGIRRGDEYAALIAQHYEQAGEDRLAADWYLRSGRYAARRYANAEALHDFTRALALTPEEENKARFLLLLEREQVLDRQGNRSSQSDDLDSLKLIAERLGNPAYQADVALRQANYLFNMGVYEEAAAEAQNAIALAQRAGSEEKEAEGYYIWGHTLDFQMARPEALEKLEQALALARSANIPGLEALILMSLGPHYSDLNRYKEARPHLLSALQLFRQIGDRLGEGKALGNLGVTYWGEGNYPQAKQYFEAAYQVMREIGDRRVEGILVGNLGVIAHEQFNYAAARRYHLQALQISQEIHNQHNECSNLGNLAEVERFLGDIPAAEGHYRQAQRLAEELGLVQNHSAILSSFSGLMESVGDHQAASETAQESLALARRANSLMYEAGALYRMGQAFLLFDQAEEALTHFQSSLQLQRKLGLENRAIEVLAGLARAYLAQGDLPAAIRTVEEILPQLEEEKLYGTDEPVRIFLTCCEVLQAAGDRRYRETLEAGYRFLQKRLEAMDEESDQQAFLEHVPWNRRIMELREAENS